MARASAPRIAIARDESKESGLALFVLRYLGTNGREVRELRKAGGDVADETMLKS